MISDITALHRLINTCKDASSSKIQLFYLLLYCSYSECDTVTLIYTNPIIIRYIAIFQNFSWCRLHDADTAAGTGSWQQKISCLKAGAREPP